MESKRKTFGTKINKIETTWIQITRNNHNDEKDMLKIKYSQLQNL